MSLKIKKVELCNFRNYPQLSLSDLGNLVIFFGPNAIGKTNILEALQLVTSLDSFKNAPAAQLVLWDKDTARITTDITDENRLLSVKMIINESKKTYFLNEKKKRAKELKTVLPAVLFSPDDLSLIKGSQSGKRNAVDSVGVQISSNYQLIKKDYEKIITQKNKLLKEEVNNSVLDSINETLLTVGTQLYCYRSSLLNRMIPYLQDNYQHITEGKETLDVSYCASWDKYDPEKYSNELCSKEEAFKKLEEALHASREEEIKRRRSLVGPHADKIDFFISQKNANIYGSQGQQRSLVLSFKLAEVEVIQTIINQKPVLLLDDVMSELDTSRRNSLLQFIEGDIQTFITTTHLEYFSPEILEKAQIIDLVSLKQKEE